MSIAHTSDPDRTEKSLEFPTTAHRSSDLPEMGDGGSEGFEDPGQISTKSNPPALDQTPRSPTVPSGSQSEAPHRIPVTVVTSAPEAGPLGKKLSYDTESGTVKSSTMAFLWLGDAEVREFDSIGEFIALREGLNHRQALVMGRPFTSPARILTQAKLKKLKPATRREKSLIARDRAHFSWPEGPAIMMLDIDEPTDCPPQVRDRLPESPEEWRNLLLELFPGLETVQMAWAPSSSSGLYIEDDEIHGIRGQRIYIPVADGTLIPTFAEALKTELVQRDLFWVRVGKIGQRLETFPFDFAVFRPEHLDFAAKPDCVPPLESRPPKPIIWNDGGDLLEAEHVPTHDSYVVRQAESKVSLVKQSKKEEAERAKANWKSETAQSMARRGQLDPSVHEAVADAALHRQILLGDFPLIDRDGVEVTVSELLEDPHSNDGREFRDPVEPDYRDDPRIAVFLVGDDGQCRIYSHAHGGQTWLCTRSLRVITVSQLHRTVDQIAGALGEDHCGLYLKGDTIVAVNAEDGNARPVSPDILGLEIQRRFPVVKETRKGPAPADLPIRPLRTLVEEPRHLPLARVDAVVRGPFVRTDGSIVDTPGYDQESSVLYVAPGTVPPVARRDLARAEALEALDVLWFPFSDFPFESDAARGATLAAAIASACRPTMSIAPAYLIEASTSGVGKTTLARTLGALQTGKMVHMSVLPEGDEEIRKHVFAAVREGDEFLLYDNAKRGKRVDSPALANLITNPSISGRILGSSSTESHPNRLTIVLTGNNLELFGDLNRRVFPIRLLTVSETPWAIEYEFDPIAHVLANWFAVRVAILELVHAWQLAGAPQASGQSGFLDWDGVPRSVAVWVAAEIDTRIGFADPITLLRSNYEVDPEANSLGALLKALHAVFGNGEFQVRDILEIREKDLQASVYRQNDGDEISPGEKALTEAVARILAEQRSNHPAQALGLYLKKHRGQPIGGLRVVEAGSSQGSNQWRVEQVRRPHV